MNLPMRHNFPGRMRGRMEKEIWIIDRDKDTVMDLQRQINNKGGMRAVCLMSKAAVEKAVATQKMPSLILLDFENEQRENYQTLQVLKNHVVYAGIPFFFMVEERNEQVDEQCYRLGVMMLLQKPLNDLSVIRIEYAARQHEMTRNYERMLQKQASALVQAREIEELNARLTARNDLLKQVFGRYFSDDVVEVILNAPEETGETGGKRQVTVMITDLRGFTAICDTLSPETVTEMVNQYLGAMTDTILDFGGTVLEFMGDGILAVFGAPVDNGNSVADAVAAGITMQNRMKQVNQYNISKQYPVVEMGIGIHRGEVFIGNIGSERLMRYNVMGKAVNLCSRIEGYSVGGQVLISKDTLEEIKDSVHIKKEFQVMPKGIHQLITICDVDEIKGEYHCCREEEEKKPLVYVKRKIYLLVRRVWDKQVKDAPVFCRMITMSDKYMQVEIEPGEEMELYTNLEMEGIESVGGEDNILFENLYGKVLERSGNRLGIKLTYVPHEYRSLYEAVAQA